MSKVICDVCGTTFPETANQCPICGNAKNGFAQTAVDNGGAQAEPSSTYSYVSGGRFSKANVRKRNKTGQPMQREPGKKDDGNNGSNKGLVIVVIVLLLAIIAVCAYIGIRFFVPASKPTEPTQQTTTQPTQTTQTQQPTETETEPEPTGIPCTDIQLSSTIIEFTDKERSQLLSAILAPVDTTDELIFTSLDPEVATVTDGGLVTPVGPGETTITITCGEIQKECLVVCSFGDATEPTEPAPTEPAPGDFELTFNTKYVTAEGVGDVTLKVGETWRMYATMNVEASMVIWTSNDEAYATIKDGVVTAVAPTKAYVMVHAEYGGVKYSCRIRITGTAASTPESTTPPATEEATPTQPVTGVVLKLNREDFTLRLSGATTHNVYKNTEISGVVAANSITWTSGNPAVCTVENGVVTAVGVGVTQIYAEYEGQTVSCIVRVQE